jgi:hypothetical protein
MVWRRAPSRRPSAPRCRPAAARMSQKIRTNKKHVIIKCKKHRLTKRKQCQACYRKHSVWELRALKYNCKIHLTKFASLNYGIKTPQSVPAAETAARGDSAPSPAHQRPSRRSGVRRARAAALRCGGVRFNQQSGGHLRRIFFALRSRKYSTIWTTFEPN